MSKYNLTESVIQKFRDQWPWPTNLQSCFCMGPQNGEPLCRCRMRNVKIENGRYVEVIDHGPAPEQPKK